MKSPWRPLSKAPYTDCHMHNTWVELLSPIMLLQMKLRAKWRNLHRFEKIYTNMVCRFACFSRSGGGGYTKCHLPNLTVPLVEAASPPVFRQFRHVMLMYEAFSCCFNPKVIIDTSCYRVIIWNWNKVYTYYWASKHHTNFSDSHIWLQGKGMRYPFLLQAEH